MGRLAKTPEMTAQLYEDLDPAGVRKYAVLQMQWYERKAKEAKVWHLWLKSIEVLAAASIPVVALAPGDTKLATAALGAFVTVLEAFQQLFRFRDIWLNYRATAESLRRDLLLHGSGGSPYTDAADANRLLAERVAAATAQENTKWIAYSEQAAADKKNAPGKTG
jgi:Protein of unknown function (DUF4231)